MSVTPNEGHFALWVLQQQQVVMMLLGKIANPVTGELDRNLEAARWHIDLLAVMEDRTRGNLEPDESRLLNHVLTSLRLNFVEEAGKPDPREKAPEGGSSAAPEAGAEAGAQGEGQAGAPAGDRPEPPPAGARPPEGGTP